MPDKIRLSSKNALWTEQNYKIQHLPFETPILTHLECKVK